MSSTDFPIPEGYYPPFAIISEDDHTGWIIIATALGLTLVLISSIIRFVLRSTLGQKAGTDDILLGVATLLAIITESIVLGAASKGLGKAVDLLDVPALQSVESSYYAAQLFTYLALGLTRCSVGVFVLRLTPIETQRRILFGVMGITVLWTVAAIFATALQCDLSKPWVVTGQSCPGVSSRIIAIGIIDILLEAALFGSVVYLVWGLRTALYNKFVVASAFAMRLPIIIITAIRIYTFRQSSYTTNFSLTEDLFVIFTITELNYSIISATAPTLRPFMNSLSTHYGAIGPTVLSNSLSRSNNANSIPMNTLKSSNKSRQRSNHDDMIASRQDESKLPFDGRGNTYDFESSAAHAARRMPGHTTAAVVAHPKDKDGESIGSNDSQRMIIRKDIHWTVQRDDE